MTTHTSAAAAGLQRPERQQQGGPHAAVGLPRRHHLPERQRQVAVERGGRGRAAGAAAQRWPA